jgi:hypothetical protein
MRLLFDEQLSDAPARENDGLRDASDPELSRHFAVRVDEDWEGVSRCLRERRGLTCVRRRHDGDEMNALHLSVLVKTLHCW